MINWATIERCAKPRVPGLPVCEDHIATFFAPAWGNQTPQAPETVNYTDTHVNKPRKSTPKTLDFADLAEIIAALDIAPDLKELVAHEAAEFCAERFAAFEFSPEIFIKRTRVGRK